MTEMHPEHPLVTDPTLEHTEPALDRRLEVLLDRLEDLLDRLDDVADRQHRPADTTPPALEVLLDRYLERPWSRRARGRSPYEGDRP